MTPHNESPPRMAEQLLSRFVPPGVAGLSILGDAREEYLDRRRSSSRLGAALWYWKHVFSLVARFAGRQQHHVPAAKAGPGVRVNNLLLDVRVALRLVRRRPLFAAAAVLSLGLGIGANTTIFSLVNTVLLEPLPYPEPERLVSVYREDPEVTGRQPVPENLYGLFAVPYAVFLDWTMRSHVFADAGAYATARFVFTGGEQPVSLMGLVTTSGVFSTLGVQPVLGRPLVPDDDEVGAPPVAVMSHGLWQRRFGGDPAIVGREVKLDGVSYTIVGVMPRGFNVLGGSSEEIWTSLSDARKQSPVRNSGYLQVIARLKAGLSVEQAQSELDIVSRQIGEDHPEEREHRILLVSRKDLVVAKARPGLIMLMGAVGLVLLIACANIANLLLVRATERRREFGIRQALGAGRGRLVVQQLVETLVLTSAGGVLGCVIAVLTLEPLAAAYPGGLARVAEVAVDGRLLAFAAILTLATALVTSVLPALRIAGTALADTLHEGGRSLSGSRFRSRAHATLIVSEVALAFVLLAGAGLFIRSYAALGASDLGFEPTHLITMRVDVPLRYADGGDAAAIAFYDDLTTRLLAIPGVESTGGADQSPFIGGMSFPPTSIETAEGVMRAITFATTITPGYFKALGVPIVNGRGFDGRDRAGGEPVVVVNQMMAQRYWPGLDPIGRRVRFEFGGRVWMTVIGVVRDVVYRLGQRPPAAIYVPTAQFPDSNLYFVARVSIPPDRVIPPVRALLQKLDPEAAVTIYSVAERVASSDAAASQRFGIALMGCLAGVAALLAIVGIYGVLAYGVSLRTHEIGIRMALGAATTHVVGGVLGRSLLMAALGCAAGLALATAASRVLGRLLYGISPTDPATLAGVAALVAVAASAAAYAPARRATRVNPVEALREDG